MVKGDHVEDRCIIAYLPSQFQTFVAIVISVIHFIVPLSQDHSPHHHSQINTLSPEVKLLHLETEDKMIQLCGINQVYLMTPPVLCAHIQGHG